MTIAPHSTFLTGSPHQSRPRSKTWQRPFPPRSRLQGSKPLATNIDDIHWHSVCPVSCALEVVGDKWTMLGLRGLMIHAPRPYSEFRESPEHIATNILAARLNLHSILKIVEPINSWSAARNNAFRITASRAALRSVVEGLGKWAQAHLKALHAYTI